MKRKIVGIFLFCLMFGSLFYVFYTKKSSWTNYALNSPTEDSIFHNMANENSQSQEFENTGFIWKESKGDEYPVYIAHTGSCFVIKTSKSGEKYRAYLGEEVSEQIRKDFAIISIRGLDTFALYGKLINFASETRYGKQNSRNESN